MPIKLFPKPSLAQFIATCTPLAIFAELEQSIEDTVNTIADALLAYERLDDPVKNLARFLQADENFLGVILSLTNLSQEKFLRILTAERFTQGDFGNEWSKDAVFRKIKNEAGFAERLARLFIDGRDNPLLTEQVANFYLKQLSLPADWTQIIHDPNLVKNTIRHKLKGEYSVRKGAIIEQIIRHRLDVIGQKYGINHTKGQVHLVGGKEVDHAIPDLANPWIMIMTSYMETTSSSQTTRANEQREIYMTILRDNSRYGTRRVFVNFVDGAGWLARRSDLRKLYDDCDYILNLNTLDALEAIVCRYIPERYMTNSKPEIIEVDQRGDK